MKYESTKKIEVTTERAIKDHAQAGNPAEKNDIESCFHAQKDVKIYRLSGTKTCRNRTPVLLQEDCPLPKTYRLFLPICPQHPYNKLFPAEIIFDLVIRKWSVKKIWTHLELIGDRIVVQHGIFDVPIAIFVYGYVPGYT